LTRAAGVALLAMLALVPAFAGCGGGDEETVIVTVTTETAPTATVPTGTAPTATVTTGSATTGAALEERLPPQSAVPGLRTGTPRPLPSPAAFVDELYQQGDPSKPAARRRFERSGYRDGVLRDQIGRNPAQGLTLLRTYVVRLADAETAQREVDVSVQEVEAASTAPSSAVPVPGIPGARGLELRLTQSGQRARVLFVTFAGGPYLYGYQAFGRAGAAFPQAEILEAARQAFVRYGNVP
jgi:hypothetical protein